MKKIYTSILLLITVIALFATDYLIIYQKDSTATYINRATIDSIKFSTDQTQLLTHISSNVTNYTLSNIDSILFATIASDETIRIIYNGSSVSVTNPFENKGVNIAVSGANVTINSTIADKELTYNVSGNSSNGFLKVYSANKYILALDGLTLTNTAGAAINIQSTKKCTLELVNGTTNTLADGASYTTTTEDQKSTLFSEGQLILKGAGTLNVSSKSKHAICSDDYIEIEDGTINITSAAKDGIHTNSHFNLEGGTVSVTATGDAVDCELGNIKIAGGTITSTIATADAKGLKADSTILVSGGTINFTVSGNQAKAIKAVKDISLTGGNITINTSGAAVLKTLGLGYDPSYCTAIKSEANITISGGNINIATSGIGNKAISADKNVTITNGYIYITGTGNGATYTNSLGITDAYSTCGIDADENINIQNGTISISQSGTAAKGISSDKNLSIGDEINSPNIYIRNTGTKLLVSGVANYQSAIYAEPKNLKSDKILTIANGTIGLKATQPGANTIDSDSLLYITGGVINDTISGNQSKGLKSTYKMTLSGGNLNIIASGAAVLEYTTSTTLLDPSYCTAIKGDNDILLSGTNVTITHTGAGGKGISSDTDIEIAGGQIKITTSGNGATYVNSTNITDGYNATCITADSDVRILSGAVICSSSGSGGKGISANETITVGSTTTSPTITLTTTGTEINVTSGNTTTTYAAPKTMTADGNITFNSGNTTISSSDDGIKSETNIYLYGGTIKVTNSYESLEAPYIYVSGAYADVTATNDAVNATKGTQSGGTESNDGSCLYVTNGTLIATCTNGDAIDSNGNILMTGGLVVANGPSSGMEEACDFNGNFNMNGGTFIGSGSTSNMTKAMSTTSTQSNFYLTVTAGITSSTFVNVRIGTNDAVTFKPKNTGYKFLISSPAMTKGATYAIYTGGSYSTTANVGGYYSGGTYTVGTSKKTGTLSTTSSVNTISF